LRPIRVSEILFVIIISVWSTVSECILVCQQLRSASLTVFWYTPLRWLGCQWWSFMANTEDSFGGARPRLGIYCWSTVCIVIRCKAGEDSWSHIQNESLASMAKPKPFQQRS
jgi:hypothetical protein